MDIILTEDIVGLGYKNELITVKPGYGRNYLIPKGMAILANKTNKKIWEENVRQAAHKAEKIKNDALSIAEKLTNTTLEIKTKAGETGKIFGSITSIQIAESLKEIGIEIDRKKIAVASIKNLGNHKAIINLHKDVQYELSLNIVAE